MGSQIRDVIKQMSPPWLGTGQGERYLYGFGLLGDLLLEKMTQGAKAALPGVGTETALPIIASDRGLIQGINETNAEFITRLSEAFDTWQHAAGRQVVLEQILGYLKSPTILTDTYPQGAIVGSSGVVGNTWDIYYTTDDKSLPPTHIFLQQDFNFNWDNNNTIWWRNFLILYFQPEPVQPIIQGSSASIVAQTGSLQTLTGLVGMTTAQVGQFLVLTNTNTGANAGTYPIVNLLSGTSVNIGNPAGQAPDGNNGSISWQVFYFPVIGPGLSFGQDAAVFGQGSIGLNCPNSTILIIQKLLRTWKSANTYYPWIIYCFGGGIGLGEMSPYSSPGSGNPDGTWGRWGKTVNGRRVPARVTGNQLGAFDGYGDGTGVYQSSYEQVIS